MRAQILIGLLFSSSQLQAALAAAVPADSAAIAKWQPHGNATKEVAQAQEQTEPAENELQRRVIHDVATVKPESKLHAVKVKIAGIICTIAYKIVDGIIRIEFQGIPSEDDPIKVTARFGNAVKTFTLRAASWVSTGFHSDGNELMNLEDPNIGNP